MRGDGERDFFGTSAVADFVTTAMVRYTPHRQKQTSSVALCTQWSFLEKEIFSNNKFPLIQ